MPDSGPSSNDFNWNDELARVRQGDEDAAKRLVEELYPTVIRIVRAHRPRNEDEQDLAQEVYMKVFAGIDQYAGAQPFAHWVSRIAVNTCYDHLRRRRSRPVLSFAELSLDESEFLEHCPTGADDPASPVAGESARELVGKLIATLKPREQIVIRLLDLEEKTIREACALTGWGESKVKVTALRARRKLAESLRNLEKTHPRNKSTVS